MKKKGAKPLSHHERLLRTAVINPETGCWESQLATTPKGYVIMGVGSNYDGTRGSKSAHRLAYETWVGPIPDGMTIDHLCRTRHCIRPDHLEPVTMTENIRRGGNSLKTHCKYGHPFDEKNTYRYGTSRFCRTCNNIRKQGGQPWLPSPSATDAESDSTDA